jgi:hypothetical protein
MMISEIQFSTWTSIIKDPESGYLIIDINIFTFKTTINLRHNYNKELYYIPHNMKFFIFFNIVYFVWND